MLKASHNDMSFLIRKDQPDVGAYLHVYKNGRCIQDSLQDDEATCIQVAHEDFGVPREIWQETGDASQGRLID